MFLEAEFFAQSGTNEYALSLPENIHLSLKALAQG